MPRSLHCTVTTARQLLDALILPSARSGRAQIACMVARKTYTDHGEQDGRFTSTLGKSTSFWWGRIHNGCQFTKYILYVRYSLI